jgi:hypothetical protein
MNTQERVEAEKEHLRRLWMTWMMEDTGIEGGPPPLSESEAAALIDDAKLDAAARAQVAKDIQRERLDVLQAKVSMLALDSQLRDAQLEALGLGDVPHFTVTRVSGKEHHLSWGNGAGFPIKPAMGDFLLEIGRRGEAEGNREKVLALSRQLAGQFPKLANAFASSDKRTRKKLLTWRAPLLKGRVSEA